MSEVSRDAELDPPEADPIKEQRKTDFLKSERDREVAELQALLATYGGRAYIWRMLETCNTFHTGFYGERTHDTAFAAGKRDVGLTVLNEMLTVAADFYNIMRDEAAAREERRLSFER